MAEARERLLEAILVQVPFDGWSAQSFDAALADSGVDAELARLACPRGVVDLALAYHRAGDDEMLARMEGADLAAMRYSARVAAGVRFRLEAAADKEIVRRGMVFFAMPAHASDGAAAIWGTCDKIWNALGDTSRDVNWYSKRAILSGVYSSTLLFWLGDDSEDHQETWQFLDRRIENVMQFEKLKGSLRKNPLFQGFMRGPGRLLDKIEAPEARLRNDLPGYVHPKS
ncbi:MAG: COQ9 family protein [Alphaproteobacteria bacterium]|nr:COQ9 family protein [Alphaproteobacteria bacterium]